MILVAIAALACVLTVSVIIHELAHYFNAKSVGVEVLAFSVGMGPVIWKKMWRNTEWRLSLLPLGGYVHLVGAGPEEDENGDLRHATTGLATKNVWQQIWVYVGGVIANCLLGIVLLAVVISMNSNYRAFTSTIVPEESGTVFATVVSDSFAEKLGLQDGDVVAMINGIAEPNRATVQQQIREADVLELRIQRGDEVLEFTRVWPPEGVSQPVLGVQLAPLAVEPFPSISFFPALAESFTFVMTAVPSLFKGYGDAFGQTMTGQRTAEVVGPVGIVNIFRQAVQGGWVMVLWVAAMINLSLAVFNLLPIPALDGGRILMAMLVAIRGKPFEPKLEATIHFVGFAFLMIFAALLATGEIGDLFRP